MHVGLIIILTKSPVILNSFSLQGISSRFMSSMEISSQPLGYAQEFCVWF